MSSLQALLNTYSEINALAKAGALMAWDRQVFMPRGGAEARTAHTGILSRMAHERLTSVDTQRLLEEAEREVEPGTDEAASVRVLRREVDIQTKFPTELVERKSQISSDAYEAWREAKATSNFSKLAPFLEQLFDIAREMAELRGYKDHIYDPLIDLFEEGAKQVDAARMFGELKEPIKALVDEIRSRPEIDDSFCYSDWDNEALRKFAQDAADAIGYDFNRGRLDITTNAFCTNFSVDDVRMTTRPSRHIGGILFSSFHEMGHGLYEQGSPRSWDRTPLAGGISLGVHESQSRTWENIVARSLPFWQFFLSQLQNHVPQLKGRTPEEFYRAINKVKPGPVRIGSDELTYNLHILVRFELECEILTGATKIKDLPDAWIAKYEQYLGVTPVNDAEGCLQDVHWSRGSVGYFPTYSMGNLIGWQIWSAMQQEVGDTDALMRGGNFEPILGWLTKNVYSQGKRFTPRDLVTRVTEQPMQSRFYLEGMRKKFSD